MTMLTADEALKLYPSGLWVFDSTGRQLSHVMACDPDTGEAIIWSEGTYNPLDWIRWRLRRVKPRLRWDWLYEGSIHTRHGFWPAPLTVEEKTWADVDHVRCRCSSIPLAENRPGDVRIIRERIATATATDGPGLTLAQLDDLIAAVDPHP